MLTIRYYNYEGNCCSVATRPVIGRLLFNTEDDKVNVIIIENPRLLYDWLTDINNQLAGTEGMTVVSTDNKVLPFSKYVELLCQFVPFELNKRNLISKAVNELEHISVEDYHEETLEIISTIESFLYNLFFGLNTSYLSCLLVHGRLLKLQTFLHLPHFLFHLQLHL